MSYVLATLLMIMISLFAFLSGFLLSTMKKSAPKKQETQSEEDIKKIEKAKKEYENFLKYDGSSQ